MLMATFQRFALVPPMSPNEPDETHCQKRYPNHQEYDVGTRELIIYPHVSGDGTDRSSAGNQSTGGTCNFPLVTQRFSDTSVAELPTP